jgi:hypothetical protein
MSAGRGKMRKPVHGFAFALWVLAGAFLFVEIFILLAFPRVGGTNPNVLLYGYWVTFRNAVAMSGELAGIGIIIEIADQIRWRGLSPEERARQGSRRPFVPTLRRWPNPPEG